jgi:hypothetical protein
LAWFAGFQAAAITVAWALPDPTIRGAPVLEWVIRYGLSLTVAATFVWAVIALVSLRRFRTRTSPTAQG